MGLLRGAFAHARNMSVYMNCTGAGAAVNDAVDETVTAECNSINLDKLVMNYLVVRHCVVSCASAQHAFPAAMATAVRGRICCGMHTLAARL